jgi:hypothetical protein
VSKEFFARTGLQRGDVLTKVTIKIDLSVHFSDTFFFIFKFVYAASNPFFVQVVMAQNRSEVDGEDGSESSSDDEDTLLSNTIWYSVRLLNRLL